MCSFSIVRTLTNTLSLCIYLLTETKTQTSAWSSLCNILSLLYFVTAIFSLEIHKPNECNCWIYLVHSGPYPSRSEGKDSATEQDFVFIYISGQRRRWRTASRQPPPGHLTTEFGNFQLRQNYETGITCFVDLLQARAASSEPEI